MGCNTPAREHPRPDEPWVVKWDIPADAVDDATRGDGDMTEVGVSHSGPRGHATKPPSHTHRPCETESTELVDTGELGGNATQALSDTGT